MRFKGNIVLSPNGKSQLVNVVIDRVVSLPDVLPEEAGRIVYALSYGLYYFNNGMTWVPVGLANLQSLMDVDIVDPVDGDLLEYDENVELWKNTQRSFVYTSNTPSGAHNILHNLNTTAPLVTVYSDSRQIIPNEVIIDNAHHLTVTLAAPAMVVVSVSKG